jgi:glycosyltransferase involved in cell wall biosynthesis
MSMNLVSDRMDVAEPRMQDANVGHPSAPAFSTGQKESVRRLRVFMLDLWCYTPYYDRYLCEGLAAENVDVTLGAVRPYQDPDYFTKNGLRNDPGLLDFVPGLGLSNDSLRRLLMLGESCVNMLALLARFTVSKPDVVHVQWVPTVRKLPFEKWFLNMLRAMKIKLAYTVHNALPHDSGTKFVPIFKQIYSEMDALICHTKDAKDRLVREFEVRPEKIWVIPHGPMLHDAKRETVEESKIRLGLSPAETVILWQGIVRSYKGIDFLLESWNKVQAQNLNARLVIAGTGEPELLKDIQEQVEKLGLAKSVRLDFKFIPDEQLPTYYQAADVLVYPYREVTTSGALMTAMAYGKAIVATKLPAFYEALRDGETALFVNYGDTGDLAQALTRLIQNKNERERLGAAVAAADHSETSWTAIARTTRECYLSLSSKSKSPDSQAVAR